jgi:SAM-dependent methyltransferase
MAEIKDNITSYYTDKIKAYGPTHKGVDWNSRESQELRFEQLLKVCDISKPFSINDYGCGYGALVKYMAERDYLFRYYGFDISNEMVKRARKFNSNYTNCEFFWEDSQLGVADYTVASGVFNVKLTTRDEEWLGYVLQTLGHIAGVSKKGFSFNMLSKYSDLHLMRPDLYYSDPHYLFDYCRQTFSENVEVLDNYGLYDFTVIVRK